MHQFAYFIINLASNFVVCTNISFYSTYKAALEPDLRAGCILCRCTGTECRLYCAGVPEPGAPDVQPGGGAQRGHRLPHHLHRRHRPAPAQAGRRIFLA
jgi:hypothetical protein